MKHTLFAATILCSATAVFAQTPTPGSSATPMATTLTGCVARADLSNANGVRGVSGRDVTTGGDADKFVLTNARPSMGQSGASASAARNTGSSAQTSSSDGAAMPAPRYALDGQSADLRQHLGHEVEIVGHFAPMAPMPTGTSGGASTGDAAMTSGQQFKVQSVKMVAATCTVK